MSDEDIKWRLNQSQSFTLRLKLLKGETTYQDLIYGNIHVQHKELDDFIVVRTDGTPTYNFSAVVDDHDMEITHVIRGEDHVANTPKQILLYQSLGYNEPVFGHLPMILGSDKKRLSKRHGAPGVQKFMNEGYLPESLLNYLALLGWNPGTEEEIFSLQQLVENFDLKQVQKKGAVWDEKKLNWLSGQHVMNTPTDMLLESIRTIDPDWGKGSEISFLISIIEMLKLRSKSLHEFFQQSDYFFNDPVSFSAEELKKGWKDDSVNQSIQKLLNQMAKISNWREEDLEKEIKSFAEDQDLGLGKIIMPIRIAVCGTLNGPSIFEILELLGRDTSLRRIETALEKLPE